jgi:hypothetical protein
MRMPNRVMKVLASFIMLALLLGGCASQSKTAAPTPPRTVSPTTDGLLVISAVYGSGISFVDVTNRVAELLHQSETEFFARPEWLHADPTPGWNKALVIVYEIKGHRHIFTVGEGEKVSAQQLTDVAKKKIKRKHHQ